MRRRRRFPSRGIGLGRAYGAGRMVSYGRSRAKQVGFGCYFALGFGMNKTVGGGGRWVIV
jgi:hypothetical protein